VNERGAWKQRAARLQASAAALLGTGVLAHWITEPRNFGDLLTPLLIERLAGRSAVCANGAVIPPWRDVHLAVGSILGNRAFAGARRQVWGSGFISAKGRLPNATTRIHAVRGPASRALLQAQGVACPKVFGDPALLLPRFVTASRTNEFALGVIPHHVHKGHPSLAAWRERDDVLVLDVQRGDAASFIADVVRCRAIASSSLHGLIVADAFEIPNVWVTFGPGVHGDGFKFADYFASIGRSTTESVSAPDTTPEALAAAARGYPVTLDLDALLDVCPFRAV
jgi:pyruvyltransferase